MLVVLWARGDATIKSYNQKLFIERIKRRKILRKEDIKRQKNKSIDI